MQLTFFLAPPNRILQKGHLVTEAGAGAWSERSEKKSTRLSFDPCKRGQQKIIAGKNKKKPHLKEREAPLGIPQWGNWGGGIGGAACEIRGQNLREGYQTICWIPTDPEKGLRGLALKREGGKTKALSSRGISSKREHGNVGKVGTRTNALNARETRTIILGKTVRGLRLKVRRQVGQPQGRGKDSRKKTKKDSRKKGGRTRKGLAIIDDFREHGGEDYEGSRACRTIKRYPNKERTMDEKTVNGGKAKSS